MSLTSEWECFPISSISEFILAVATFLANSRINEPIDIEYILVNTISKELGGIETHGKARKIYVGGSHYI